MSTPIDPNLLSAMIDRLANFPSDGKPPIDETTMALIACGFIERQEVQKHCATCGTLRLDYSYLKLTAGGRAFLTVAQRETA